MSEHCLACRGTGYVTETVGDEPGQPGSHEEDRPCPECVRSGRVIDLMEVLKAGLERQKVQR